MTHDDLVKLAAHWLRVTRKMVVVATEAQGYSTSEFPDAIGWDRKGNSILIECKTSVEDFRRDANKHFRRTPSMGMGLQRYYLTPPGLLLGRHGQLPERWGLLETPVGVGKRMTIVRTALPFANGERLVAEAPLLVRMIRATKAGWDGTDRIWVHAGQRPVAAVSVVKEEG